MQRLVIALLILGVLLVGIVLIPQSATAQDGSNTIEYIVKSGDTLYRIARTYQVTVASILAINDIPNPNLITVGQKILIPARSTTPTVTPSATASTTVTATSVPSGTTHRVGPGENLFRISLRYGTTVQAIMNANSEVVDPNVIYVGQVLRIPPPGVVPPPQVTTAAAVATTPAPVETVTATTPAPAETEEVTDVAGPQTTAEATVVNEASNVPFAFGMQVDAFGQDTNVVVNHLNTLQMNWVKQVVDWSELEPTSKGSLDSAKLAELDIIVDALDEAGFNILLTVTNAPSWSRPNATPDTNGPPANYQDYADFIGALAARYSGIVDAYEVWNEPNLASNWTGKPITGTEYVSLLAVSFRAIKSADPAATVVSAGLAPTGTTGPLSTDDREFLRQMYAAGLAQYSDAIGAHPFGWANSPQARCCEPNPTVRQWDDHPSFFFLDTLIDYDAIKTTNNDDGTLIWVTAFGWGTSDGFQVTVNEGLGFLNNVTMDEQMIYTLDAFEIAESLEYVGPMFLSNLNLCVTGGLAELQCFWGLLDPAGNARPVYNVLSARE